MLHTLHVGYIAVSIPSDSLINYLKISHIDIVYYIFVYTAVTAVTRPFFGLSKLVHNRPYARARLKC